MEQSTPCQIETLNASASTASCSPPTPGASASLRTRLGLVLRAQVPVQPFDRRLVALGLHVPVGVSTSSIVSIKSARSSSTRTR